jgi:hypothetical protein
MNAKILSPLIKPANPRESERSAGFRLQLFVSASFPQSFL